MSIGRVICITILVGCLIVQPAAAVQFSSGVTAEVGQSVEDPAFAKNATSYSATLGTGISRGLDAWGGDTGSLSEVTYNGKQALETDRATGTNYIYFDVAEGAAKDLPRSALIQISVEFWNGRKGAFRLEYDGYGDFAADSQVIQTTGTDEWRTAKFTLNTAKFAERLNNGDFRVNPLNGDSDLAVRNVTVTIERPKLTMEQEQLGNIFLTNETPGIVLSGYSKPVSWTVYNYSGQAVANGTAAAPGKDGVFVRFPIEETGHYRVTFRDSVSGIPLRETSFAVLPPAETQGYARYGVSTHYGQLWRQDVYQLRTMQLLERAGVGTFRDNVNWVSVEKSRGEYTFPVRYDEFMRESAKYGLEPFIILAGTNPLYDNGATVHSEEGRRAFGKYSRAVVNRYDRLEYVEVYNEFNIPRFGDRGDGPADATPQSYTHLLNTTANYLAGTGVTLVGPATSGVPYEWLAEIYARGALQRLDIVSVHPYTAGPPSEVDEKMNKVDELTAEYDVNETPLWISENGWSTSKTGVGVSFEDNAEYLVQAHVLAFSEGTERYYSYELIDGGPTRTNHQSNFGLVHTVGDRQGSYTPKPAYTALAVLTRTIEDAPYRGEDDFEGATESYIFANPDGNGTIRVMWRPESRGQDNLTIRSEDPVTIVTMMGATRRVVPVNGTVEFTVDDAPIYVYGLGDSPISEYEKPTNTEPNPSTPTPTPVTPSPTVSSQSEVSPPETTRSSSPGLTLTSAIVSLVVSLGVVLRRRW